MPPGAATPDDDAPADSGALIRIENLHKHFGGIRAVDGVDLEIAQGSITGLIGPNGAGKTTLFNVIAGVHEPSGGRVYLRDSDVTGLKPHELFHRGVVRTFQIAHEFTTLTVLENLMAVPSGQAGESLLGAWLQRGRVRAQEREIRWRAQDVMEFLKLDGLAHERAGSLSGGQKKLLELGRTMMAEPSIVLLDEVGAGVNRTLLRSIGDAILRLNREHGYTFCMIEHDMDFISRLCEPVVVMAEGAILTQGSAEAVKADPRVIEAYLGRRAERGAPPS